LIALITQYY